MSTAAASVMPAPNRKTLPLSPVSGRIDCVQVLTTVPYATTSQAGSVPVRRNAVTWSKVYVSAPDAIVVPTWTRVTRSVRVLNPPRPTTVATRAITTSSGTPIISTRLTRVFGRGADQVASSTPASRHTRGGGAGGPSTGWDTRAV